MRWPKILLKIMLGYLNAYNFMSSEIFTYNKNITAYAFISGDKFIIM